MTKVDLFLFYLQLLESISSKLNEGTKSKWRYYVKHQRIFDFSMRFSHKQISNEADYLLLQRDFMQIISI